MIDQIDANKPDVFDKCYSKCNYHGLTHDFAILIMSLVLHGKGWPSRESS